MLTNKNIVCAIVVTYNRLGLLKECIKALQSQTYPCDILVIDNSSTDETEDYLSKYCKQTKNVFTFRTKENIGGAGGFNIGIKIALYDYEYFWLMDDDCVPQKNALKELQIKNVELNGNFGFLSSRVLWIDNKLCKMNAPKYLNKSCRELAQGTFVSMLLSRKTIINVGLPIKDFFIWGDDIEFSRRIINKYGIKSYEVNSSVVIHKTKDNIGSNICYCEVADLKRYYFSYRNEFFLYKMEGITGVMYYKIKIVYNIARILMFSRHKSKRIKVLLKGVKDGKRFNPKIEYYEKYNNRIS